MNCMVATAARVDMVSPFPICALPQLWEWANEFPDRNFDDSGPQTKEEFLSVMPDRFRRERTWGVTRDGKLVGFIAYLPITRDMGTLHGVCFSKVVHGTGIARKAICQIVRELFSEGIGRISASFFATTPRIEGLLRHAGFERDDYLPDFTQQHGKPLDMIVMSAFAERNA